MNIDWVVVIITGIVASVPGFYAIFAQRKKIQADTRKVDADVATQYEALATRQAVQIAQLSLRQTELESVLELVTAKLKQRDILISEWQAGISLLVNQLTANGMTPVWKPKPVEEIKD